MSLNARRELIRSVAGRYAGASHAEKMQILDEFTASTGYHRKYAISILKAFPRSEKCIKKVKQARCKKYNSEVQSAFVFVWEAAGRICTKRLIPFLPEIVEVLEHKGHLDLAEETRSLLLAMSAATADRLLAPIRRAERGRGRSTTRPGSLLKHQVPIRTFADWDDLRPGFVEADLVAHCGGSVAGSYLHTLTVTDVSTGWTECLAIPYREQMVVLQSLKKGRERLPFPLLGLDTDNGSEFLNYTLLAYCDQESITFTRSRAYKKNDQCHVEQKNGSIVRRFIGYERFEGLAPCRILSLLYQVLRLYVNFFQPSMKLLSKKREKGRITKKYDTARTPYQRTLASDQVSKTVKAKLRKEYRSLDPIALLSQIQALQDRLWTFAYLPAREADAELRPNLSLSIDATSNKRTNVSKLKSVMRAGGDRASEKISVTNGSQGRLYRKKKRKGRYHLVKHTWRTRPDPFADVKNEIEEILRRHPHREAKSIFKKLQQKYPGKFTDGQLRTLQRRVKAWRLQQATAVTEEIEIIITAGESGSNGPSG